jgi:multiple sugar transport system permease protein
MNRVILTRANKQDATSTPSRERLMRRHNLREAGRGYLFLLPVLLVLLGLMAYPMGRAVWMSFTNKHPGETAQFVGFSNYHELVTEDITFPKVVLNSLIYTVGVVGLRFGLGMIMALVLNSKIKLREFFRGWLLLPWIMPTVTTALTWTWMLNSQGVLNHILTKLHLLRLPIAWIAQPSTALLSVIMASAWAGFPFIGIGLLAGMQAIPDELYDAAKADGASALQQLMHVTLPGLRNVIITLATLSTVWVFNSFLSVWLITKGGPGNSSDIIITYAYKQGLGGYRFGYAAAISLVFAPVLFFVVALLTPHMLEEVGYSGSGVSSRFKPLRIKYVLSKTLSRLFVNIGLRFRKSRIGTYLSETIISKLSTLLGRMKRQPRETITNPKLKRINSIILRYLTLIALVTVATFPLYWMIITSLKEPRAVFQREGMLLALNPTLANYVYVIIKESALLWIKNSTIVASVSSGTAVLISALCAYSLVRIRYPGKQLVLRMIVLSYLIPYALLFIPLFVTFFELGFQNTRIGLILVYMSRSLPFMTWFLIGYIRSIPKELEEAAFVDGCRWLGVLFRIVLPLIMPGMIAVWIFGFTQSWNEYVMANLLITNPKLKTVALGLTHFLDSEAYAWGPLMSMSVLATIPTVLLYMFAQRFLVKGLTAGAIKG